MCINSIRYTCALTLTFVIAFVTCGISAQRDTPGTASRELGRQAFTEGRYSDADRELRLALREYENVGDPLEIAETLGDLGSVLVAQERYSDAEQMLNRALALMPETTAEHARLKSRLLGNLGALYVHIGRDSEAASALK